MDGGGGRKGANHLYHSARPDGLTIGGGSGAIVALSIMREQGVSYDADKFIYLGTPESENHAVIYTRTELGLDNLEKLKAKPGIRIGGQTVGHTSYVAGRLFAYFLDMKEPKFIVGYTSPEVDVALVNGELDARANSAISVLRRNPEWLEKKLMNFHAIMEIPKGIKHPRLAHLPEIETFAKTEREKKLLTVWRAFRGVGSPLLCLREHPKTGFQSLQKIGRRRSSLLRFSKRRCAGIRGLKIRKFLAKYFTKLVDDDPSPLGAAELSRLIREMPRDPEVLELVKKFSGARPAAGALSGEFCRSLRFCSN